MRERGSCKTLALSQNPRVPNTDLPGDDTSGQAQIRTFLIADVRGYTLFTRERGRRGRRQARGEVRRHRARDSGNARRHAPRASRGRGALRRSPRRGRPSAPRSTSSSASSRKPSRAELPLTVGVGLDAGEAVAVQGGYRGGGEWGLGPTASADRSGAVLAPVTNQLTVQAISDRVRTCRSAPVGAPAQPALGAVGSGPGSARVTVEVGVEACRERVETAPPRVEPASTRAMSVSNGAIGT